MNVTIVVPSLKKSGPLEVVYSTIYEINKNCNVNLVFFKKDENEDVRFYNLNNIKIIDLSDFSLIDKYRKIKEISKSNLIHSHGLIPDILNALLFDNKSCSTLHAYPIIDYKMKYGFKGYIYASIHVLFYSLIKNKFTCSELLAKNIKINNVHGINNGVINDIFYPPSINEKSRLKMNYNLEGKYVYYFVGSLITRKNIKNVLLAYDIVRNSNTALVIAGDGELKNDVINSTIKDKSIVYVGKVNNPDLIHKMGDCIIAPSFSEGFGLMVAEAISCGSKAIISDIDIFKNLYSNDDMVKFVNPKVVSDIADAMNEIIESKTNYNTLLNKYSSKVMGDKYFEFYKSISK